MARLYSTRRFSSTLVEREGMKNEKKTFFFEGTGETW